MASPPGETQNVDIEPVLEKPTQEKLKEADKIWTLYNDKAKKHDDVLVSRLKGSMDSILVFAGLFSAVVTAFIIESYKLLSMDSGDTTVFYLAEISQQLANGSQGNPPFQSISPPSFEASPSTVAVNVLWILSLIFSLACALGATLIQTWTSRYMRVVDDSPDAVTRARDRAWFFEGLEKSQMAQFADGIPALLHMSLFLFLAGLVVFFFPINHQVARVTLGASVGCAAMYLTFAILHVLVPNSPYRTPFSTLLVMILFSCVFLVLTVLVLGLGLAVAGVVLAIALAIFIITLPLLPFVLCLGYRHRVQWGRVVQERAPRLPDQDWDRYRKEARSSQLYNRMRGTPAAKPTHDAKALRWLLEKMTTVPELEQFVEGIEPLIERSSNKALYAKVVLEIGEESVGTFSESLGLCVGALLASCAYGTDIPPDRKRSRAIAATRAIVSVFSHSKTGERVTRISDDETSTLVEEFFDSGSPNNDHTAKIRWEQWVSNVVLETMKKLRGDKDSDPVILLHTSCLSSLLIHRAISDIASRMRDEEVHIHAPANWDLRTLIGALRKLERFELYELIVAVQLMPSLEDAPMGFVVYRDPPEGTSLQKEGRPISVTIKKKTTGRSDSKLTLVSHATFRNEALLLTLSMLLDYLYISSERIRSSTFLADHSDLITRTLHALAKGGSAKETSVGMQRKFVNSLRRIYRTTETGNKGAVLPTPVSHFITLRSILLSKETMRLLLPIVESLNDSERSDALQVLPRAEPRTDAPGAVQDKPERSVAFQDTPQDKRAGKMKTSEQL